LEVTLQRPLRHTARQIAIYLAPHRGYFALATLGETCGYVLMLLFPVAAGRALDAAMTGNLEFLKLAAGLTAIIVPLTFCLALAGRIARARYMARVLPVFREQLLAHIQTLPLARIEKERSAELLTRLNGGIDDLAALLNELPVHVFEPILFIVAFAAVLWISWPLLLLAALTTLPSLFIGRHALSDVNKLWTEVGELQGRVNQVAQEAISGAATVKAYGLHDAISQRLRAAQAIEMTRYVTATRRMSQQQTTEMLMGDLPQISIPVGAALLAYYGQISLGAVFSVPWLISGIIFPARSWFEWFAALKRQLPAIQRGLDILDMAPEPGGAPLTKTPAAPPLELRAVHFRFDAAREPVLDGVSIHVDAGSTVALVGASGGGKSTLVKLAAGLYAPDGGEVRIFGQPLAGTDLNDARRHMALVSQDTFLYPASIEENIALGRPDATQAQVVASAKAAYAHEFILAQPEGYQTRVGERGVLLSGGQRQRIALARAILKDAPILLLDEPTASLDTESEQLIQTALAAFSAGRATLVVSHRLSTIRNADLIVVLAGGRVVEQGTHEELMRAHGRYHALVAGQSEVQA
jgi:ABC-type multidrug transport system fused ATPase/permease subunit